MILKLRTILFWTHLAVGVAAGLFILNMAVSGILIAYEKQITTFAERSQRTVVVPAGQAPLDVETLVAKVQEARPNARFSGIVRYADPAAAAMFYVGRNNQVVFANPYTGEVLGEGQKSVRAFFQFMTGWHRWLALEGTARPYGQAVTGVVSIIYLGLLFSGLCLWLPRQWSRTNFRQITALNWRLRGKAREWNWHNVVGIWCAPLLLAVTLTGVIMSYDWASDLLFRLTGNPAPEHRRQGERGDNRSTGGPAPKLDLEGLNGLWVQAEKHVPGWHSISLRLSSSPDAPASFMIDSGDGGRPDAVAQLAFDRDTGETTKWQPYEKQSAGQKLRSWVRPLHTGQAAGFIGECIAVLAAFGSILLVWSGLSMAYRRFFCT